MSLEDDIKWLKAKMAVMDAQLELATLERDQAKRERDELMEELVRTLKQEAAKLAPSQFPQEHGERWGLLKAAEAIEKALSV